jgi:hypothetical protein
MVKETDLAWLASFIEAEGSISAQTTIRKNGNLIITPFIRITNSSNMAIKEIERICKELKVTCKVYWRKDKHCTNLPICNIRIEGSYSVATLIDYILPYLKTEKIENAVKVREFVNLRKNGLLYRNKKGQIQRNGYTIHELKLITSIRKHFKAKPLNELLQCNNIVA